MDSNFSNPDSDNTEFATQAYARLGPAEVLAAVESRGYACDGRLLALNSYENRVYRVGIESAEPIVAKFYRPNRWSDAAIREEHGFAAELAESEIPVIAPLQDEGGETLFQYESYRFAVFPCRGGRAPELDNPGHLSQLGRFLGRLHAVGGNRKFEHRSTLTPQRLGEESTRYLLEHGFIPDDLSRAYVTLCEDLMQRIAWCFERAGAVDTLRLHGDCHAGNVLWTDHGFHIVDLDDAMTGPAVQDLWLFLSGDRAYRTARLHDLLDGYTQFRSFDARELNLVEALRTLRMMHYHAWLARRWDDPAFPRAFPWFGDQRCWQQHILDLREQAALMDEPPIEWV